MAAILKSMVSPLTAILVLLAAGVIMTSGLRNNRRTAGLGWRCVLFATIILYGLSTNLVASSLCYLAEKDYMGFKHQHLQNVDAVIVLGGGVFPDSALREHALLTSTALGRLITGIEAFRVSGAKHLVLSGGPGFRGGEAEAEVMRRWAIQLGVGADKIITEPESMNTFEEAKATRKILAPRGELSIGLVTSALHMKRAMWIFGKYYNKVVPVPADYQSVAPETGPVSVIPYLNALSLSTDCLHEFVGYIWYRLRYSQQSLCV